jgi:Kef-type K+ transport system membrane component KefB
MEIGTRILLDLFIIYSAAVVGGALANRLRQPPVIGELVAGVVIGPYVLGLAGEPNAALVAALGSEEAARLALEGAYGVLAEFGLVLLLFFVGLELRIGELLAVGRRAALVGIGGIAMPFAVGYALATFLGWETIEAIFLAAALVSTSTGITARVLRDLGVIASTEARIILAAAVIDDVLSMIVIAVIGSLGERGQVSLQSILFLVAEVAIFIVFVTLIGTRVIQQFGIGLAASNDPDNYLVAAIVICLGLAVLASSIGMAPIIGAFLAGPVIGESWEVHRLTRAALPIYRLLVPFFFVITGMRVDPALLIDPTVAGLAALVTAVAIVTKLLSGMLGSVGLGTRSALIIGVGMVPRGEIGFVVVAMGRSLGVLPESVVSVVVVMTVVTTMIVPPILGALYRTSELSRTWGRLLPPPWRPLLPLPSGASHRDFTAAGRLPGLGPGPRRGKAHAAEDSDRAI